MLDAGWHSYQKPYYVDRSDPSHVVAKIKVHLVGDRGDDNDIKSKEDAIEKHLAIPGFTVDVEFVDADGDDVHTIDVDRFVGQQAVSWRPRLPPSHYAHELGHHLGLDDEYDRAIHFRNKAFPWYVRWFDLVASWFESVPPDGAQGLMGDVTKPLLRRHVDTIAGIKTRAPDGQCGSDIRSGDSKE